MQLILKIKSSNQTLNPYSGKTTVINVTYIKMSNLMENSLIIQADTAEQFLLVSF